MACALALPTWAARSVIQHPDRQRRDPVAALHLCAQRGGAERLSDERQFSNDLRLLPPRQRSAQCAPASSALPATTSAPVGTVIGGNLQIPASDEIEAGALIERQDLEVAAGVESRSIALSGLAQMGHGSPPFENARSPVPTSTGNRTNSGGGQLKTRGATLLNFGKGEVEDDLGSGSRQIVCPAKYQRPGSTPGAVCASVPSASASTRRCCRTGRSASNGISSPYRINSSSPTQAR